MSHIFSCPAPSGNINRSIRNPISLEEINRYLTCEAAQDLSSIYGDNLAYLWAPTPNQNEFKNAQPGSILLLRENGHKEFGYYARIVYLTEGQKGIGEFIWGAEKWRRLLFLEKIKKINIPQDEVYKFIGGASIRPATTIKKIELVKPPFLKTLNTIDGEWMEKWRYLFE